MALLRWLIPLLATALVLFVGSLPAANLPADAFLRVPGMDKAAHFALYGLLGLAWAWGAGGPGRAGPIGVALTAGFLLGLFDEWHQSSVAGRTPDPWDLLADVLGAAAGGTVVAIWRGRRPRTETGPGRS